MQPQLQHDALLVWQFRHGQLQAAALFEIRQVALWRVRVGHPGRAFICVGRGWGPMFQRSPVVGQTIVGNPEQPGREGCFRPPAHARADHALPDILKKLIGQRRVAHLPQQEAIQAGPVARIQLLEGRRIAGRIGQHQGLVGGF